MTTRLYYNDAYQTSFSATVLSCIPHEKGYAVVLDRTAFYPTSGGQPFDVGTLGESPVREVLDGDDGQVLHVVDRPLSTGAEIAGAVDWGRRFDHMQQHTGQHVLSAAFDRLFSSRTESFHLGTSSATIDLAMEMSAHQIRTAEDEANRVVWENREVLIRFVSGEEARALPLRKEPTREGLLRLVEVTGFDLSACGGTHVSRTGAIGIIAVAGFEKFRGGTRVEFVCGHRALHRFREWRDVLGGAVRHLSIRPAELVPAIEKLQSETRSLQKTVKAQQEQLAAHEGRLLVAHAETHGARRVLVRAPEGYDATALKALAVAATAAEPDLAVALFTRTAPLTVVVAAGSTAGIDAAAVLKLLTAQCGGRGGGKRELAQGSLQAPLDEALDKAHAALRG